jgi:ABC-2 type transport system ATP-binding protein
VVPRGRTVSGLFDGLARCGIEVSSLRNKQNRLEQFFIDMVDRGRQAQGGAQ